VLVGAPQEHVRALAPLRLAMVAAVLAVLGHVVALVNGRRVTFTPASLYLGGALLAWTMLTMPLSIWPGGSLSSLLDVFLKSLVVFWLLARVVNSVDRLYRLAAALSLLSIPIAVTGIKNFLGGAFMYGRVVGYSSGLAFNPNDLALTLDILLPISVAVIMIGRSWWLRMMAAVAAGLSLTAVVVTFSRGGFLGLAIIVIASLFWLVRFGQRGIAIAMVALAVGVLPFIPAGYAERLQTVSSVDADPTGSAQQRWRDMVTSTRYVSQHPLVGAGLGMDVLALNEMRGREWKSVHDVYLEYAVDLGLPGLALYVALIVASVTAARRVERDGRATGSPSVLPVLAGAIRISLMAFAVAAVFYPVAYHFYFYYLAGLAAAARTLHASAAPAV